MWKKLLKDILVRLAYLILFYYLLLYGNYIEEHNMAIPLILSYFYTELMDIEINTRKPKQ